MKTLALGIRYTDDDAEVRMMLESETLWETFVTLLKEVKDDPNQTGLFVVINHRLNEQWIVQDFCGVPGDEGQTLMTIPIPLITSFHPVVMEIILSICDLHKVTAESFLKAKFGINYPNPERN